MIETADTEVPTLPGFIPVDISRRNGEDPDPQERYMPHWAPNLDLPEGAR